MIGRDLLGIIAQEVPQGSAVVASPGDAPFRVKPLEVADQQHPEVHARRDARPPQFIVIKLLAQGFDEPVEAVPGQKGVELPIERMPRSIRYIRCRDPQFLLPLRLAFAHGHRWSSLTAMNQTYHLLQRRQEKTA